MTNWLRKNVWNIIFTIIGIVAILVTYDVFFRSKPIKEIKVITNAPLSIVDVNPEAAKDIEILYKGKPVNNISLFQIQITNTGNQPILENEYSAPLSLSFSSNDEILDAAVISANPPNIGMGITQQSQNQIELSKALFNPQDTISIRFVLKGNTGDSLLKEFKADGRIAGIKNVIVISSVEQNKSILSSADTWLWISQIIFSVFVIFMFFQLLSIFRDIKKRG